MSGPWERYGSTPPSGDGPWAKYGTASAFTATSSIPADTRPTSQMLGAEEGAANVFDRGAQALKWAANQVHLPFDDPMNPTRLGDLVEKLGTGVGLPSTEEAAQGREHGFAEREKTEKPGGWGRFGGEVLATLPLGGIANPWVLGGAAGGLAGRGEAPGRIATDVGLGAAGGKIFHAGTGYILRKSSPYLHSVGSRATDYVSRLMENAGKTPEDVRAVGAAAFGKPLSGAEAIGRQGVTAATALGRREGATPDALEGFAVQRRSERASRMLDDMTETTGVLPQAALGELDSLVSLGRKEAEPLYQAAFDYPPRTTPRLEQFSADPLIQQGMQHGYRIEQLAALKEGKPFDPGAYGVVGFQKGLPGTSWRTIADEQGQQVNVPIFGKMPTWKAWDAAKTGIDHILETNYRNKLTGKLELDKMGREIEGVRKSMLNELDNINPSYRTARARAGDYLSAREAFHDGTKMLFDPRATEQQFVQRLGKMSVTDMEALKGGVANHLFNLAQTGKLKPSLLNTPRVKSKLVMVFGRENTQKLIDRFTAEHEMAAAENRMQPGLGSVTSEVLNATGEQDTIKEAARELAHAGVYGAAGMWHAAAFRVANVLRFVPAFARTSGMPVEMRDEVGKMLLMTPDELADQLSKHPEALKALDKMISRIQGPATSTGAVAAAQAGP